MESSITQVGLEPLAQAVIDLTATPRKIGRLYWAAELRLDDPQDPGAGYCYVVTATRDGHTDGVFYSIVTIWNGRAYWHTRHGETTTAIDALS